MGRIAGWLAAAALAGMTVSSTVAAQTANAAQVRMAAEKFAGNVMWRPASVLEADFNCTGKVQYAILGTSAQEIVVAIFNQDLTQAPALLRFDSDARNGTASKIRLDDYSLTAAEIAGVSGAEPVGYRQSIACHGVRLSDDSHEAAHIYWDHDNGRFDSWAQ
jgi:hypothetical protein